jgi:hypothetical protein
VGNSHVGTSLLVSAVFNVKNIFDLTGVVAPACLELVQSADSGRRKHASRVSSYNVKNILLFRKF